MSATSKIWLNNNPPSVEDDDLNGFKNENNNLIEGSGQTLSTADLQQTHKAVATYAAVGEFFTGGGIADAYTANAPTPRINPAARKEGMIIRFIAPATNTGASTLNAFGTGLDDIKLRNGTTNPSAGDIVSGEEITVIDRVSFFELVRTGLVTTRVITSDDATLAYTSGVKSAHIKAIGAGSGAGGVDGQGASTQGNSTAGAGGGVSEITLNNPTGTLNISIGAAGSGGAAGANDGSAGGITTVVGTGVNLTANGGGIAPSGTGTSGSDFPGASGGGTASGGDVNYNGKDGQTGRVISGASLAMNISGSAPTIGGGVTTVSSTNGTDATNFGEGGGAVSVGSVTDDFAGGDGFQGAVILTEYF